jgi:two-component system, cell cycle response regulator DivK
VTLEGTPPRVLLVEDDRDGRRLYAQWLTDAGFRVQEAHNGLQALERAFDARPDIVVTDLHVPGIDGFELARRLKQDPRTRDVPVLAVTGYVAFASDPGRALRAGCDAVLPKPYSPEDLEAAIRNLIEERSRPLKNTR